MPYCALGIVIYTIPFEARPNLIPDTLSRPLVEFSSCWLGWPRSHQTNWKKNPNKPTKTHFAKRKRKKNSKGNTKHRYQERKPQPSEAAWLRGREGACLGAAAGRWARDGLAGAELPAGRRNGKARGGSSSPPRPAASCSPAPPGRARWSGGGSRSLPSCRHSSQSPVRQAFILRGALLKLLWGKSMMFLWWIHHHFGSRRISAWGPQPRLSSSSWLESRPPASEVAGLVVLNCTAIKRPSGGLGGGGEDSHCCRCSRLFSCGSDCSFNYELVNL